MHAVPGRSDDLVGTGVGGVFVLVRVVLFSDVESTWCSGVGDCWLATVCQGYCLSGLPETFLYHCCLGLVLVARGTTTVETAHTATF